MKQCGIAVIGAAMAIAFAGPAHAAGASAVISAIKGDVMINQGEQFVPAQPGATLAAGDRLMVAQGASAEVTFTDGCLYSVTPGTMITVPAVSTCAGGAALAQSIQPAHTGALGGGAAAASVLEAAAAVGGAASMAPPLVLGAAALATAAHVVVTNASSNDKPGSGPDKPLSP